MYLSRKIIKIFLRITSYPSFFPDTVLELPIDCTRTASLIPAPAPDRFPASVTDSSQKIFWLNHTGAPAYATLPVTQFHRYLPFAAFTTTPLNASNAMIFGITISPLKKSARAHTSSSFSAEPMTMQSTTMKE